MTTPQERLVARAEVVVEAQPGEAFRIFTDEIGLWWRRNTPYWNDAERGLTVRIEPFVGGRFVEVYDLGTGEGFEVGRVTVWEPGARVRFTWHQIGWAESVATDVDLVFEPVGDGSHTRVVLEHSGFERVGPAGEQFRAGYGGGWTTVLGWYAERVREAG